MRAPAQFLHGLVPAALALSLVASPATAQEPARDPALLRAPGPARVAAAPEYDLPPDGARWNLLLTGVAITGVWYGAALGASFAWPSARTADELRIPIAGPWMALGDTGCKENDPDCSTVLVVIGAIVTAFDGVGQAGGLAIALESLFLPTSSAKQSSKSALRVRPVPIARGRDGLGLGVVGEF